MIFTVFLTLLYLNSFQAPLFGSIKRSGLKVSQFTQNDLENGLITYVHTGPEASNGQIVEDSFKVKVTDGTHNRFYVYPNMGSSTKRSQTVCHSVLFSYFAFR